MPVHAEAIHQVHLFVFLDDSLSIHERFTSETVPNLLENKIQFSFLGNFAEILFWLIALISFLALILLFVKTQIIREK